MKVHALLLFFLFVISSTSSLVAQECSVGNWTIEYDGTSRSVRYIKNDQLILGGVYVKAKVDGTSIQSTTYENASFSNEVIEDEVGPSQKYTIEYTSTGKPTIRQIFYLYPDKDFFLTEVVVASEKKIQSNYLAPVCSDSKNHFLPKSENNRFLTVPFDNDGFVTYGCFPLTSDSVSFEVSCLFNGDSQKGLVLGSVDHTVWKSAVRLSTSDNYSVNRLECFSGITHPATRDEISWEEGQDQNKVTKRYLIPHGSLRGNTIKSSRMMVGLFDDWRDGLESYGEVNEAIAPKRTWEKGVPFGWNSWGGLRERVNFLGAVSVSTFIGESIQGETFNKNNPVYIGLDSYWDNLNDNELLEFANHCYENGQIPGIYWTPFCDWFGWSRQIEGSTYNYSDVWLKCGGKTRNFCLDPTHPGTIDRMKYFVTKFKNMGFKYIKLDFMNAGTSEADYYYDRYTTTGIQAYNYGMSKFKELCGDDMFIVLSIAPLFPANYAHARRISCDAWGEMWHTQYMMNSLSYGWWLDRVYTFNDPDHLVVGGYNDGENRARMTSGAITGLFMLGDNLSNAGSAPGTDAVREKVKKYTSNKYINELARLRKSFRPAYGHIQSSVSGAVDLFTCETTDHYYIAYFNYGSASKTGYLDLDKLGINSSEVIGGRECWMKIPVTIDNGNLRYSVPSGDARVYMLDKRSTALTTPVRDSVFTFYGNGDDQMTLVADETFNSLTLTSLAGRKLLKMKLPDVKEYTVSLSTIPKGINFVTIDTSSGKRIHKKINH